MTRVVSVGLFCGAMGLAVAAAVFSLSYGMTSVLFAVYALGAAPVAVHKIDKASHSIAVLVGLSLFVGYPIRRAIGEEGAMVQVVLTVAVLVGLWVAGFGWRRAWT